MTPTELKTLLKDLIAESKTKTVIQHLLLLLKDADQNSVAVMQSSKFENLKSKLAKGIISHENATLEYNQINYALIQLIEEMALETEVDLPMLKNEEPAFVIRKKTKPLIWIVAAPVIVVVLALFVVFSAN